MNSSSHPSAHPACAVLSFRDKRCASRLSTTSGGRYVRIKETARTLTHSSRNSLLSLGCILGETLTLTSARIANVCDCEQGGEGVASVVRMTLGIQEALNVSDSRFCTQQGAGCSLPSTQFSR